MSAEILALQPATASCAASSSMPTFLISINYVLITSGIDAHEWEPWLDEIDMTRVLASLYSLLSQTLSILRQAFPHIPYVNLNPK